MLSYPYLPLLVYEREGRLLREHSGLFFQFIAEKEGNVYINVTGNGASILGDIRRGSECEDKMDMKQANLLAIDSMADESAYPDGYNKQVSSWFSDLKVWFEDTQRPPHITTVAPADPPAAASCVPNPSDPVKDSHEGQLEKAAKYFCKEYASGIVQGPVVDIKQAVVSGAMPVGRGILNVARLYTGTENRDDVYDISIQSVKGCKSHGGFNLDTPVANNQCSDILHSAWKQCNNQGRGGSIVAGCLTYSISTRY
ncbi:hypothetical protein MMC24_003162 [Lignoscripta atroalba]|nr:hypothetical protein [Lignoscripta atroalba]